VNRSRSAARVATAAPIFSPNARRRIKRLPRTTKQADSQATATRDPLWNFRQILLTGDPSTWREDSAAQQAPRFPPEPGEHPIPFDSIVQLESKPNEVPGAIYKRAAQGRIYSAMQRRTAAATQPGLIVTPRDDRPRSEDAADFTREALREMGNDLPLLRGHLMDGLYRGAVTAEKVNQTRHRGVLAGYSVPRIVEQKMHQITWRYAPPGKADDPQNYTAQPGLYARRPAMGDHVPLSARRAIHFAPHSNAEPYGSMEKAPLELVYWATELARFAFIDEATMIEQAGLQKYAVTMDVSNDERRQALATAIDNLRRVGWAMLADDEKLDALGAAVDGGTSGAISNFRDELHMIAVGAILAGGFDSAGMGRSGGSFARANAGDKVARVLTLMDMAFLERVIEEQLVWWILAENFGAAYANAHCPYVTTDAWSHDEWQTYQTGMIAALDRGIPVTPELTYRALLQSEPPPPDADVIVGKSAAAPPPGAPDPEQDPQETNGQAAEGSDPETEAARGAAIMKARERNTWRKVDGA
jgi:hypothetical protein